MKIGKEDASVIIDGQNDFILEDGALPIGGIDGEVSMDEALDNILTLSGKNFGYRVTTEDKHPKTGHIENEMFGPHCVEGTSGQRYHKKLRAVYKEAHHNLVKGMDPGCVAYSVATSPDFVSHLGIMKARGIKRVFLSGFALTHCVGESAISYATQKVIPDLEVYIVRDATRSVPPPHGDAEEMLRRLEAANVKIIYMKDIE